MVHFSTLICDTKYSLIQHDAEAELVARETKAAHTAQLKGRAEAHKAKFEVDKSAMVAKLLAERSASGVATPAPAL